MRCLLAFLQLFGNVEVLIDYSNKKLHENDYERKPLGVNTDTKKRMDLQFANKNHPVMKIASSADCPNGISATAVP